MNNKQNDIFPPIDGGAFKNYLIERKKIGKASQVISMRRK